MNFRGWRSCLFIVLAVVAVLLLASSATEAQCSMCRAALTSSTDTRLIRNFNLGVLVLLVPPVSIFCSIFIILRRHRGND
jgi:hypothetical protein